MRVHRTPGTTSVTLRRSSRLRGPSGNSAAPAEGASESNQATATATAPSVDFVGLSRTNSTVAAGERPCAYPTAFFTAASSSSGLNAPSRRAATRPSASKVNVHGSVGRRKAVSCGR
jgi:hypothetical protein